MSSTFAPLETTTPLNGINLSSIDIVFSCPPADLKDPVHGRKKIEEAAAMMRALRGNRLRAQDIVEDENGDLSAPAPKKTRTKKAAAPLTSVIEEIEGDGGF